MYCTSGERRVSVPWNMEEDLTTSQVPKSPGTTKKLGMANSMLAQTLLFIDLQPRTIPSEQDMFL
jgi:hypothetical protein